MCGNKWWSTKVGAKFLSDLVILSIPFSKLVISFLLAKFAGFSRAVKIFCC